MSFGDFETTADALYREAGLDPASGATPFALATALLGKGSVRYVHASNIPGDGRISKGPDGQSYRIDVRTKLPAQRRKFAICHELAEWHLIQIGYCEADVEQVADVLGAAILAPRRMFLRALRDDGVRFPILARRFGASESWAALRTGETTGEPLVLVGPGKLRVRGEPSFVWPSEAELRAVARGDARPEFRRIALRDDAARVVLLVA